MHSNGIYILQKKIIHEFAPISKRVNFALEHDQLWLREPSAREQGCQLSAVVISNSRARECSEEPRSRGVLAAQSGVQT